MNQIVPSRFLFRWSFEARQLSKPPSTTGRLFELPIRYELPSLADLDGKPDFARVKMAWNADGIGLSILVDGKTRPPKFSPGELLLSDRMQIWIDTRNTQNVHRATKFCHSFVLMPVGGGAKRNQPGVRALPVARAREESALPNTDSVRIQSAVTDTSYQIDAWFPAEVFTGFDPVSNPKIGFHYAIYDSEFGEQTLAVGSEFPYESDPSLWQTVELVS